MNNQKCPHCGSYTPEYLLERLWIDELLMQLSKSENEYIAPDTISMSDFELFSLLIHLQHKASSNNGK